MSGQRRKNGTFGVMHEPRAPLKQGLTSLACSLLPLLAAMLIACPFPDFDVQPNQPLVVADEAVVPLPGIVPPLDCTSVSSVEAVEFRIDGAVEDLDGDSLSYFWYVNYDEEQPSLYLAAGVDTFPVNCKTGGLKPGLNVIDVVVMDRAPSSLTATGAREAEDGGYTVRVYWILEVAF